MFLLRSIVLGVVCWAGVGAAVAAPFASAQPLRLQAAIPNTNSIARYATFELSLDLAGTWENPFDPAQVDVQAAFTRPDGVVTRVAGFFGQSFRRSLENGEEKLTPAEPPGWRVRFTPSQAGQWRYEVEARDRTGVVRLPPASFTVRPSADPGFIRLATNGAPYFMRDDGRPYYPVGENVCWGGKRGLYDYEDWLPALGQAGGNFIRVWMSSWNCALEWTRGDRGDWRSGSYHDVGVYSLENAWKLDQIFELAERQGIALMLCLGTYGELKDGGYFGEGQWKANPYNATNGGPCLKPLDVWTNDTARRLYQQRLRYLGARYGHRVNLHSWEFWNEAEAPAAWVAEMARCLKGKGEFQHRPADPYGHLVSTTYGKPDVWRIEEIDFTQTHHYGMGDVPDHAPVVAREARAHAVFGKPHWMAEFGIDWRAPDNKYDPDGKGVNLHNGLWASALSGDAGAALIWWWDSYVHPQRLYAPFRPLRQFTDAVPWTQGGWKSWPLAPVEKPASGALNIYGLVNERMAIAWIQNADHHWKNRFEKKSVAAVPNTLLRAPDLAPGRYRVEWWDTWNGGVSRTEVLTNATSELKISLPELLTDVALRVTPLPPGP